VSVKNGFMQNSLTAPLWASNTQVEVLKQHLDKFPQRAGQSVGQKKKKKTPTTAKRMM